MAGEVDGFRLLDETSQDEDRYAGAPRGSYWLQTWTKPPTWLCVTPNGLLGALRNHQVTVHEDGTITASPSILVTMELPSGKQEYHGYLRRVKWMSV